MDIRTRTGSKLIASVARHPYISLAACVIFILGVTTGISANIAIQGEYVISGAIRAISGGARIPLAAALLRSSAVNLFFFLSIAAAKYLKPLLAAAFLSVLTRGFLWGFAARALIFEFGASGVLYTLAFTGIPLIMIFPALLLCLGMTFGVKNDTKPLSAPGTDMLAALLMLLCGTLVEGLLVPYVIQLVC